MVTHIAHIGWGMPIQGLSTMALAPTPLSGNGAAGSFAYAAGLPNGLCSPGRPERQPSQSIFDRFWRGRYSRDLAAAVSVERHAAAAFDAGDRDGAAGLFMEAGGKLWSLSQDVRAGLWRASEHAYVKGTLIAMGMTPDLSMMQDRAVWLDVASSLVEKKILATDRYGDSSRGDEYIVVRTVGMGRTTTVHKIFGRKLVLKLYDGGANNYMHFNDLPPALHMNSEWEKGNVICGLERTSNAGLATASIVHDGKIFLIQKLIEGPTKAYVRTVLPWDEMPHVVSSFDEYVAEMKRIGLFSDFDGNFAGNLIYERKTRRWVMVDF